MEIHGRLSAVYRLMKPRKKDRILDLGCSAGHFTSALWRSNIVVGVDVSAVALSRAKANRRLDFVLASVLSLPFRNSVFNKIAMLELLEHLGGGELEALKEANRVMVKGGVLVMSTPNKGKLSAHLLLDPSSLVLKRHTHFSIQDVIQLLEAAEFKRINVYTGGLFAEQLSYFLNILVEFSKFSVRYGFRETMRSFAFRGLWVHSFQERARRRSFLPVERFSGFLLKVADREFDHGVRSKSRELYSIIGIAGKE